MACPRRPHLPAMLMEGGLPNFFTINGKAYPDTQPIRMRVGERVRIRFIGTTTTSSTRCTFMVARSRSSPPTATQSRLERACFRTDFDLVVRPRACSSTLLVGGVCKRTVEGHLPSCGPRDVVAFARADVDRCPP